MTLGPFLFLFETNTCISRTTCRMCVAASALEWSRLDHAHAFMSRDKVCVGWFDRGLLCDLSSPPAPQSGAVQRGPADLSLTEELGKRGANAARPFPHHKPSLRMMAPICPKAPPTPPVRIEMPVPMETIAASESPSRTEMAIAGTTHNPPAMAPPKAPAA